MFISLTSHLASSAVAGTMEPPPLQVAEKVEGWEGGGQASRDTGTQVRSSIVEMTTAIGEVGRHDYHGGVWTKEFGGSMPPVA